MHYQLELPGISRQGYLRECLQYLVEHDLECEEWTRRMHADHARYLLAFFGDVEIRAIRYTNAGKGGVLGVKDYYDSELRRGLSRESIRKRLYTLKMAMESAIRRELMEKLPPWVVIKSDSRKRHSYWTLAQWELANAACADEELRIWIAIAFWCGMHSSDIDRLRWSDLNMFKRTWIRRNTKSKAEPIELDMPERLYEILRARSSSVQPHPRDLVAGRRMGHPNRAIKELCHNAGVPVISPIGLRHSCATFLNESGVGEQERVMWFGHKSPTMLKGVYTHATPEMMAKAITAVNSRH